MRTTEEVLTDHLELARQGDVETDLQRNFSPDCVLLTGYGIFKGYPGIRAAAQLLEEQVPNAEFVYRTTMSYGEIAFLEWSAKGDGVFIEDGADSYLIRDGRIEIMTIHYTPQKIDT